MHCGPCPKCKEENRDEAGELVTEHSESWTCAGCHAILEERPVQCPHCSSQVFTGASLEETYCWCPIHKLQYDPLPESRNTTDHDLVATG